MLYAQKNDAGGCSKNVQRFSNLRAGSPCTTLSSSFSAAFYNKLLFSSKRVGLQHVVIRESTSSAKLDVLGPMTTSVSVPCQRQERNSRAWNNGATTIESTTAQSWRVTQQRAPTVAQHPGSSPVRLALPKKRPQPSSPMQTGRPRWPKRRE